MPTPNSTRKVISRELECQAALEQLISELEVIAELDEKLSYAMIRRNSALARAYESGAEMAVLRELTGLSRQRVYQIFRETSIQRAIASQELENEAWQREAEKYRREVAEKS